MYQNTTGKPMFVSVVFGEGPVFAYSGSNSNASGDELTTVARVEPGKGYPNVTFWVLPNNYYRAIGFSTILAWVEWY